MTNLAGTVPHLPEDAYKTTSPRDRRRLQAEVVTACRDKIRAFVRRYVPAMHREEGEQVCALGVLVALEKYDPAHGPDGGADRGKKSFWAFAFPYVREELRMWMDHGVRWRNSKASNARKAEQVARGNAKTPVASLDFLGELGQEFGILDLDVEDQAGELEATKRLRTFTSSLCEAELSLLFPEKAWNPNTLQRRLHLILVGRARAAVRGSEADVCGNGSDDARGAVRSG